MKGGLLEDGDDMAACDLVEGDQGRCRLRRRMAGAAGRAQGEETGADLGATTEDDRPFDDIGELADIPRPVVGEEEVEGGRLGSGLRDAACYFSIASIICALTTFSAFKYISPRFAARLTPDEPR